MAKQQFQFEDFLTDVNPEDIDFVTHLHEFLLQRGCTTKIQLAKSGYVVSYVFQKTKKVLANYVFRKKGLMIRIYGECVNRYMDFVSALPENMIRSIEKAPVCKRLMDPATCSSRCPLGYAFTLGETYHKKCRYSCFMFLICAENNPHIMTFLEKELNERSA